MHPTHIIIHTLNHSGISNAATTLANTLAQQQIPTHLLVIGKKQPSPYPIHKNVSVNYLNTTKNLFYIPLAIISLAKYMLHHQPKNIITWGKEFSCITLALRKILFIKCKLISVSVTNITNHLNHNKNTISKFIHHHTYKLLLPTADHIIAQSDDMTTELTQQYNIPKAKLTVIYPPIQEKFFTAKHKQPTKSKPQEIIFIGKLNTAKDPKTLLNIFTQLITTQPNTILKFIGTGELYEELQTIVHNNKLENKIYFTGTQDNVIPAIQNATILASTSKYEGFGMVLAEAIACGTPVISFNCPVGPANIIKNGTNGYLIPVQDTNTYLKKLITALNKNWDPQKIRKTAQKFHPDTVMQQYIKLVTTTFYSNTF